MMDTNKMREEFEAWQAKETPGSDLLRIGKNEESYRNMYVAERWIGWQASRESLVVELPSRADTGLDCGGWPLDSGSHRVNGAIDKCKNAIHATGIRTK